MIIIILFGFMMGCQSKKSDATPSDEMIFKEGFLDDFIENLYKRNDKPAQTNFSEVESLYIHAFEAEVFGYENAQGIFYDHLYLKYSYAILTHIENGEKIHYTYYQGATSSNVLSYHVMYFLGIHKGDNIDTFYDAYQKNLQRFKDSLLKDLETSTYEDIVINISKYTYTHDTLKNALDACEIVEHEGIRYFLNTDHAVVLGYGNELEHEDVVIPAQINQKPVLSITNKAFENTDIKTVFIPSTVLRIGFEAFKNSQLQSITFDETSNLEFINNFAFAKTKLHTLFIPKNVKNIGPDALLENYELKSIHVDSSNIHFHAQDDVLFDKHMTKLIVFPVSKEITHYEVPASVTHILKSSFRQTTLNNITFESGSVIQTIETYAFWNSKLDSITLPISIEIIGPRAFGGNHHVRFMIYAKALEKLLGWDNDWLFKGSPNITVVWGHTNDI